MAIEFDAITSTDNASSDVTISHAAGASVQGILYIIVQHKGSGTYEVYYDGSTTGVVSLGAEGGHPNTWRVWYYINPSSDAKDIRALGSCFTGFALTAVSYLGVDTDNPHGTLASTDCLTSGPMTVVLENDAGQYNVMFCGMSSSGGGYSYEISAPVVERYDASPAGEFGFTWADDSNPATTSVTYTFTQSTNYLSQAAAAWPLIPVAVASDFPQACAGTMTPAGTLFKATTTFQTGTMTPAGAVIKGIAKPAQAGTVTPAGAVIKGSGKAFSGELGGGSNFFLGILQRGIGKIVGGTVTPAGVLERLVAWYRSLAGTVTPAGTVIKGITKPTFTGLITPAGAVIKGASKLLAGAITPAGRLLQRIVDFLRVLFDGSPETVAQLDITPEANIQLDNSPETTVILEQ